MNYNGAFIHTQTLFLTNLNIYTVPLFKMPSATFTPLEGV